MFWLPTIKKQTNTAFFCPRLNVLGCEKNKLKNRLSGGNCNRVVLPNLQRYQDGKLQVSVYDRRHWEGWRWGEKANVEEPFVQVLSLFDLSVIQLLVNYAVGSGPCPSSARSGEWLTPLPPKSLDCRFRFLREVPQQQHKRFSEPGVFIWRRLLRGTMHTHTQSLRSSRTS